MTLAAFYAAIEGYMRVHTAAPETDGPSEAEYLAVLAEEMAAGRA